MPKAKCPLEPYRVDARMTRRWYAYSTLNAEGAIYVLSTKALHGLGPRYMEGHLFHHEPDRSLGWGLLQEPSLAEIKLGNIREKVVLEDGAKTTDSSGKPARFSLCISFRRQINPSSI